MRAWLARSRSFAKLSDDSSCVSPSIVLGRRITIDSAVTLVGQFQKLNRGFV